MNVLLTDWIFYDFLGAEGDISARIEIGGSGSENTLSCSPCFNFGNLDSDRGYCGEFLLLWQLHDSAE